MELTIKEALTYTGVSKVTYLKKHIPHSVQGRKKLYAIEDINKAFSGVKIPRILPSKAEKKVEVDKAPAIELDIEKEKPTFVNILNKVKMVQGEAYQREICSSLVESLIKTSILERYYFEQLQIIPDSKDLFTMYKQSIDTKINLTKKLGI